MAGYWQMLQQQPGAASVGNAFASTFLAAKAARQQKKQQELAASYQKYQMDRQASQDAAHAQQIQAQREQQGNLVQLRKAVAGGDPQARAQLEMIQPDDPYLKNVYDQEKEMYGRQQDEFKAQAAARKEQEEANKPALDPISRVVINRYGLKPGTPDYQAAYAKEQGRQEKAALSRAHAIGGKQLPTASVTDIADATAAMEAADSLLQDFTESVPTGLVGGAGARVSQYIPNSEVKTYSNNANIGAQVIGSFLEGGKLAESDFHRYKSMLPAPGDNQETAAKKISNLKNQIEIRTRKRMGQLEGAGYRVPKLDLSAGDPPAQPPMQDSQQPPDVAPPPQVQPAQPMPQQPPAPMPQQQPAPVQQQPQAAAPPQAQPMPAPVQPPFEPTRQRRGDSHAGQSAPSPAISTRAFSPDEVIATLKADKKPYQAAQILVKKGIITADQAAEYVKKARGK